MLYVLHRKACVSVSSSLENIGVERSEKVVKKRETLCIKEDDNEIGRDADDRHQDSEFRKTHSWRQIRHAKDGLMPPKVISTHTLNEPKVLTYRDEC